MAVIAIVLMLVLVVHIVVMCASGGFVDQLAIEIRDGNLLGRGARFTRQNRDALQRKHIHGALPDAARNDDVRTLLAQPARKNSRRMRRRDRRFDVDYFSLIGVRLHERELPAAAKMSV